MRKLKKADFTRLYPLFFTVALVLILFQYSFSTIEATFYDLRAKLDFGMNYIDNIVLIELDEESDQFLGESYPYTLASHQKLLKRLLLSDPKMVGYLVSLSDFDSNQEVVNEVVNEVRGFQNSGGIFRFGTQMDSSGERLPPEGLRSLGFSLALINIDNSFFAADDVSRRVILNVSGEESFHLWMANRYREKVGLEKIDSSTIQGSYYLTEADATFAIIRYFTNPVDDKLKIKRIPFHKVVVGNFNEDFFKDKIVLVSSKYVSNASDFVLTPFNKEEYKASTLAVHANIIQSLIQNKTVFQVPRKVSYLLSILIAIMLSVIISRMKPTHGLMITMAVMIGSFVLSFILFNIWGWWLYLSHIILTIFAVYYIWVPFRAIREYQSRFAIQEETKLLKKVENLKRNFISLMSHDLKTPVAKIAGLVDIMLRKTNSDEEKKNLKAIIDSTKELNSFITSILDLTKIESQNMTLNIISKDVNQIVEQAAEKLTYEAEQKNVLLKVQLSPLYPIKFDVVLMNRVISNLVENAIKYSGENTEVTIKSWDDEKWVYIEITDNGVGIPKEDLGFIFEKFYRVKNDASHSIKGTGLGLYLVKYFVELHGGQISAESVVGEGTKFLIKLKNE